MKSRVCTHMSHKMWKDIDRGTHMEGVQDNESSWEIGTMTYAWMCVGTYKWEK